jgi:hypothetical protein
MMKPWLGVFVLSLPALCGGCEGLPLPWAAAEPAAQLWRFDRPDEIGGNPAHVEGHPQVVTTPAGKALVFDGVADALFVDDHPLAGAEHFTFEAVIRPDGGAREQRWMHLSEIDPQTGQDSGARFTFEIRVVGDRWYLDAFIKGPGYSQTLTDPAKTHPLGAWYRVAQSFDGKMYRSYVDGVLEAEAPVAFKPQGAGHASVGVRINHVDYFRGAIFEARFSREALAPAEFLPLPDGLGRAP